MMIGVTMSPFAAANPAEYFHLRRFTEQPVEAQVGGDDTFHPVVQGG